MQKKVLLGYSESVLSLVIESFIANGHKDFTIVKNVEIDHIDLEKIAPPGINITIVSALENLVLSVDDEYSFSVATPVVKRKVYEFFNANHSIEKSNYGNLFHPSVSIASSAKIATGCYIEPLTVVSPFAVIGFGVTINRGVSIGHHVVIDDFATINPGVNIGGNVTIGKETQVGIGTSIFNNVTIGSNSFIGGGSVVTKDIPDNVIAWGNPCTVKKEKPTV